MRVVRPRVPPPTTIVNCSFLKLTIWPRMTLPFLRRIVSANAVRLRPNARATSSRERKKNFFMTTSRGKATSLIDCLTGTCARCHQESNVSCTSEPFLPKQQFITIRAKIGGSSPTVREGSVKRQQVSAEINYCFLAADRLEVAPL